MSGIGGIGVHEIAERAGVSTELVRVLLDEIADAIASGERVKLRGFGSFERRDPETAGKRTPLVKFQPAKPLRAAVCLFEKQWHASRKDTAANTEEE